MAKKDPFLAIVLLIWLMEGCLAVYHKQHRITVRTSKYDSVRYPSFLHVPAHIDDYGIDEYEKVMPEVDFCYPLDLYCLCNDPRFCLFFDKRGRLAGVQMSYPTCDLSHVDPQIYNISNPNLINTNFYNISAKSVRVYITNPDDLTEEGRYKHSENLVDGLWTEIDGLMVKIDRKCKPNSPVLGDFNMMGCSPKIGQLYLRRFGEMDQCQNGFYLYLLYEKGDLVGFGHAIPGIVSPGPKKNVYNYPNGTTFKQLLPNPPPCFHDMAQYGFTVIGIWFIEDPWNIRCAKCLCNS